MKLRNKTGMLQVINGKRVRPLRTVEVESGTEFNPDVWDYIHITEPVLDGDDEIKVIRKRRNDKHGSE